MDSGCWRAGTASKPCTCTLGCGPRGSWHLECTARPLTNSVCVLPLPVWPYASTAPLQPFRAASTGASTSWKTSAWLAPSPERADAGSQLGWGPGGQQRRRPHRTAPCTRSNLNASVPWNASTSGPSSCMHRACSLALRGRTRTHTLVLMAPSGSPSLPEAPLLLLFLLQATMVLVRAGWVCAAARARHGSRLHEGQLRRPARDATSPSVARQREGVPAVPGLPRAAPTRSGRHLMLPRGHTRGSYGAYTAIPAAQSLGSASPAPA